MKTGIGALQYVCQTQVWSFFGGVLLCLTEKWDYKMTVRMLAGLLLVCFVWVVFLIVVGLLLGFIMLKRGMEQQPQPLSLT